MHPIKEIQLMKISYNWLGQFIKLTENAEKTGELLTDLGLEVEGITRYESIKGGLKGVVVGHVLSCDPHPNADRLKVTTVDLGGEEPVQIVCGAPNVAAGQKVIVATCGTTLYPKPDEAFKIKPAKIRGVESQGMLCAEDELGLGQSHDGILVLPENTPVGMTAAAYFELEDDYEIEIGLTPNRADAMGHIGVARDLAAYMNYHHKSDVKLVMPDISNFKVDNNSQKVEIEIENTEKCARYCGLTISGLQVTASPAWLQKRLRAVGLSPINNVVDVTNFVMRELGTPLHAFDLNAVGSKIVVRNAKEGSEFTTLDGVARKLNGEELMITNGNTNLCIAGVFGGKDSGVSAQTTSIFLESAYFNPVSVRKTAKFHGLNTDASFRFERGVDPSLTMFALKRAALLIKEIAGGEISMEAMDLYPATIPNHHIEFSYDNCRRLIGANISNEDILSILSSLEIQSKGETEGIAQLEVPAYRVDVTREADVIEEVLRIYGFNNVPIPEKLNASINISPNPDPEKVQSVISDLLVSKGFFETLNNSLTSSNQLAKLGGDVLASANDVEMLNPLSQELNVLRQTLLFPALEVVQHNQNRQNPDLKIFEFGKTYRKIESKYVENKRLLILISGKQQSENWNATKESVTYFTLKGIVNALFQKLGLQTLIKENALDRSLLKDGVQLEVLKNDVGEMGWISDAQKKYFDIKQDVFVADLDWDAILKCLRFAKTKYTELPKTFAVRRDFSLLLNSEVSFSEIEKLARAQDKKI